MCGRAGTRTDRQTDRQTDRHDEADSLFSPFTRQVQKRLADLSPRVGDSNCKSVARIRRKRACVCVCLAGNVERHISDNRTLNVCLENSQEFKI